MILKYPIRKLTIMAAFCFFAANCSHNVPLDQGLSEAVMAGTRAMKRGELEVDFRSKLPEPFKYETGFRTYEFKLNSTFRSKLDEYAGLKFPGSKVAGSLYIEATEFRFHYGFEQTTSEALFLGGGTGKVHAEMSVKVAIKDPSGRSVASRTIKVSADTSTAMGGDSVVSILGENSRNRASRRNADNNMRKTHDLYAAAANKCLNKSILKIDRFIDASF